MFAGGVGVGVGVGPKEPQSDRVKSIKRRGRLWKPQKRRHLIVPLSFKRNALIGFDFMKLFGGSIRKNWNSYPLSVSFGHSTPTSLRLIL